MSQIFEISPSLFYQYERSPHWIWYDIHGDQAQKIQLSEFTLRLIEGGVLHEEEVVKDMQKAMVDENLTEEDAEELTLEYMKEGRDLIYQGVISYVDGDIKFKGRPDLLRKCKGPSSFGDYHYIPIEIKNSTKCDKPKYKKQLMLYALILENIQGYRPPAGGFINKNKDEITCDFTEKLLKNTHRTIDDILSILRGNEPTLKVTRDSMDTPWGEILLNEAEAQSDISLLYNINSAVAAALKAQGIKTYQEMAQCDIDCLPKIKGASLDTLQRLQKQAEALLKEEIIPIAKPDVPEAKTKIYFDIEGDPFLGVDYLFGFLINHEGSKPAFKYFLAETPEAEVTMWSDFLSWLEGEDFGDYKVYHYHDYEKTHIKKLSEKYGGSKKLDEFASNLVDLSPILTKSYIFPLYFYSIKDIAKYLDFEWRHAKAGGAQSIFWYEEWFEKGDRTILQDIINYNEDDVRATEFLHKWLVGFKQEG